jgi:4-alpha-glucanotransferase
MNIESEAARRGIETSYEDVCGHSHIISPEVLARLVAAVPLPESGCRRAYVLRRGRRPEIVLDTKPAGPIRWDIIDGADHRVASGTAHGAEIELPAALPLGTYDLRITAEGRPVPCNESLLVAPIRAYQGPPSRMWALGVQLYGVRSGRNWGHGDFGDLERLVDLAAEAGAAGLALNPLHDTFEPSPYSPSSRLFLNSIYIDLDALPEFAGARTPDMDREIDRLRGEKLIDHAGVSALKWRALALAFTAFRQKAAPARQRAFAAFCDQHGTLLRRYACFELLRRRFATRWQDWPADWRDAQDAAIDALYEEAGDEAALFAFVQWNAHDQLTRCRDRARRSGLPLGLYLDMAVGVRPDGFDAWTDRATMLSKVAVGAPPDVYNPAGQNWGLATYNPGGLAAQRFEPFRRMLRATMQYAGAIRIDHVLGLKRIYLVPDGETAVHGAYIRFPLEALLAVLAQESHDWRCPVIGEDLGTVPPHFRETLADWGVWSYLLMLFERTPDGAFQPPQHYREKALAAFTTHDLPTYAGWISGHDLKVKAALGIDPGETAEQRKEAQAALQAALRADAVAPGTGSAMKPSGFTAVAHYLARTPSRLVLIALEDVLGAEDQVNVPGTVDQYPNWRVRLDVPIEDIGPALREVAEVMKAAGRGS